MGTEEFQMVFMDLYPGGSEDPLANIFVCRRWGDHIKCEFWKICLAALWNVTGGDVIRSGEKDPQIEVIQEGEADDWNRVSGGAGEK